MTNYIPHHRKKKDILKKKEYKLVKAISANMGSKKIAEAAQDVREAQIRVINVKRSELRPVESDKNTKLLAKCDKDIEYWLSLSIENITEIYKIKKA